MDIKHNRYLDCFCSVTYKPQLFNHGCFVNFAGGLATVIFTDALAVCIMVIGGFILCIMGMVEHVLVRGKLNRNNWNLIGRHCRLHHSGVHVHVCEIWVRSWNAGFIEVGGMTSMAYKYMRAVPNTTLAQPNTTCGYPRDDALHIFRYITSVCAWIWYR